MSEVNNVSNACSIQAHNDKTKEGPWPAPRVDEETADRLAKETSAAYLFASPMRSSLPSVRRKAS